MTCCVAMLSQRVLNRTLLQRQMLDARQARPPAEAVRHLVAMQAQHPNGPYVGLWARLAGFEREQLTGLLNDRSVVRSTMVRRTQHVAASEDFLWLRPTVSTIVLSALKDRFYADKLAGLDLAELAKTGCQLMGDKTMSRRKLGALLAEGYPGRQSARLADAVEIMEPMVHPPPTSTWGTWGHPSETFVALAEQWIGQPMREPAFETLILRYLAAYGPASVADIQAWAGITRLRAVAEKLRPRLRVFRNEAGVELLDLPEAPIASADLDVPVRFLPGFENALLGHKDRTRVISEEDRKRTAAVASGGVPMFLVDGFVAGTWSFDGAALSVKPYRRLSKADTAAVSSEAQQLLAFVGDGTGKVSTFAEPP